MGRAPAALKARRIDSATQRVPIEGPLENLELDPQIELLYRLAR
ncbi:MAG TPA: hypothetical protein VFZ65_08765 [Planctomycetota bacterium]|nr:hypothetical protein [Planctomycetota bacterium]